ncbi:MAG TPA: hypothetical protein ENN74_00045 [Firmicutes bacterium]|nr:hypothetical protein [Bacillota bacterium]
MMRSLFFLLIAAALVGGLPAVAQDLDTTAVSDQFDSGLRGQETSGCGIPYGGACTDGSDAVIITDASGVTGSISYVNTWAGASAQDPTNGESPVWDVTVAHVHPDRGHSVPAIPANTRPGATSPNMAVVICDDGGHNGLFWGQADNQDYYLEADVYCKDRSGELTTASYEAASICVRAASREGSWVDYTFNMDRTGSYAIVHDRILNTIEAVTWARNTTISNITTRAASSRVVHASLSSVAEGWHTFKIDCRGQRIIFSVDGAVLADVIDASYEAGYPGLVMREGAVDSALEHPAYYDNMRSGPSQIPIPTPTQTPVVAGTSRDWRDYR